MFIADPLVSLVLVGDTAVNDAPSQLIVVPFNFLNDCRARAFAFTPLVSDPWAALGAAVAKGGGS